MSKLTNRSAPGETSGGASAATRGLGDNLPLQVEWIETSQLTLLDAFRVFSKADTRIARRIGRRFGVQQHLVVDECNRVVIGEVLLLAARECGIAEVPVMRLKAVGELEAKALAVAYQRLGEIGKPDQAKIAEVVLRCEVELGYDIEDFGFSVAEVDIMLQAGSDDSEETPVALEQQAVSELGIVWVMDKHRLICGDALEASTYDRLMEGKKAHGAFADAPYGDPIDGFYAAEGRYREFVMGGDMSPDEIGRFFKGFNRTMAKYLACGAAVYETIDWRHLHQLLDATRDIYGPLVNFAVWVKDRPGQGSFLRSQHELVLILKTKGRMRNNVMLGAHGRNRSNVWSYPSALTASKGSDEGNILAAHPTPKCARMIADALLDTTKRSDLVLDPFSGSGSTLIACERIGRRARLIELDPIYVDLAVRRWQAWTGGTAIDAATGESFDARAARVAALAAAAQNGEA